VSQDGTVRPFSSGSEFSFWTHRNCHSCRKYNGAEWNPGDCEIEFALALAYFGEGVITEEMARRAALPVPYPDGDGICPEREERP
jgi:hypothetical protein